MKLKNYFNCKLISKPKNSHMGNAGKKRAEAKYDWSVVMRQYHDLWEQLAEIRVSHKEKFGILPHKVAAHQIDPYRLFAHYPTVQLTSSTQFQQNNSINEDYFEQLVALKGHNFAKYMLPNFTEIESIMFLFEATKAISLADIVEQSDMWLLRIEMTVSWLLKIGILSNYEES